MNKKMTLGDVVETLFVNGAVHEVDIRELAPFEQKAVYDVTYEQGQYRLLKRGVVDKLNSIL